MSTEDGPSSPSTTGSAGTSSNAPNMPRRPPSHVPFISLHRPAPGQPPNTTDERCLFYCTQSALHRAQHKPPTCRSICLRRVYPFEVEIRTSTSTPTIVQHEIPLPPEGQHSAQKSTDCIGPGPVPASNSYSGVRSKFSSSSMPITPEPQPQQKPRDTRIWNPGLYVWTSTSARAVRDKIETMTMDLGKEHAWTRKRQEWIMKRAMALREHLRSRNAAVKDERVVLDDGIEITKSGQIEGPWSHSSLHSFSLTDSSSLLTPLSAPLLSLAEPIRNLLNPTTHALSHFRRALADGSLYSFGERAWKKACTPDPLILARKAVERVWKKEGGEGDGDVDG
ncbi:hypothetical protein EV401DRAFT_2068294 [Pisolithus croceorrhizus]|nr:hypothetical protein EV401DRAFT_2068294 [Pisolithus croceorrhizus]